ncbi:Glycosyl transferase group 1 [Hyella patelloides LEGE 07179]|uniref:Glycosyl transferase group 1 n=1 Tax=Hyella patelloides LEGE 07179 TaxID=945734 RepID=A0A563VWV0_9CYAN|nr:glycosyltransferase [Hyella patelloides]VEP15934.1 Glycosyl transferase group 1 [Hyella patelloides LEGE 07179]
MKIALVHDYLTQRGGAERVFEMLCSYFPQGDIYTSVHHEEKTVEIEGREVHTTFLQDIPGSTSHFRLFVPLYYPAFRSLDLQEYDLIISSTSSFAKGVRKKPGAMHICFCHNVTRFLWDTKIYLQENNSYQSFSPLINQVFNPIRKVDLECAQEPDLYIANSSTVAKRIKKYYKRNALTVNYPIDTSKFIFSDAKEEYYLISSRMISYKRLDIVIEAFNWLGLPLIIIGDGPERARLESLALDNIKFLGYVEDELRANLMAKAKGVIVMALEDYGLVPIEANASGTPVIAYGAGGVLDTQIDGVTGILFSPQTPEALHNALFRADRTDWDYQQIRNHAVDNFSESVFFSKIKQIIGEFCGNSALEVFS